MLMIVTGVKIDVVVHTLIHVEPALQTQRNVSSIVVRGGGYSVGGSRSSSAVGARGAPRQVFTSGVRVSRASGTAITIVAAVVRTPFLLLLVVFVAHVLVHETQNMFGHARRAVGVDDHLLVQHGQVRHEVHYGAAVRHEFGDWVSREGEGGQRVARR